MTDSVSTLSPSEQFTDLIVRRLDDVPPGEWGRVAAQLVREYPDQQEVVFGVMALHRRCAGPAPVVRSLGPGDRLGAFGVTRLLRRGGMGEVYLALQTDLDRPVALKVIRRGFVNPVAREKFVQENRVLARLHHSNIVPVHFAGEDHGLQYCVMHLVDGVPLDELIAAVRQSATAAPATAGRSTLREVFGGVPSTLDPVRSRQVTPADPTPGVTEGAGDAPAPDRPGVGPLSLPPRYFAEVAELVAQVADAVHHAHEQGVCHRDLKPSNLIVDREGKCWVLDFGLAGVVRGGEGAAPTPSGSLDWQTTLGGTPQYMPPEQYRGHTDQRSDVYGIGLVLYELLTLHPAFPREGWAALRSRVETQEPAAVAQLMRDVPPDLTAIVRQATRKDPAGRYQSADALAADLRRFLRGEPTTALPRNTVSRLLMWVKRHPWRASAVAAVVASLLAVVVTVAALQVVAANAKAAKEQAAREKAEFARAVLDVQRQSSVTPPRTGWPKRDQDTLRSLLQMWPGEDVRDTAVDTLSGVDAVGVFKHDSPLENGRAHGFAAVAFSPDGAKVVAGGWSQLGMPAEFAAVWDGQLANRPVPTTRAGGGPVAFPDADSPLTLLPPVGEEKGLILWNVSANRAVVELPLPEKGEVGPVALSPDAALAAAVFTPPKTGGGPPRNPLVLIWAVDRKTGTARKAAEWEGHATALAFSPDGSLLAVGTVDGGVSVRTAADGKELFALREGDLAVTGLGFGRNFRRPSGKRDEKPDAAAGWLLGVGCQGGDLSVWNLRTRSRWNTHRGSDDAVYGIAFSPDGTTVASSGRVTPIVWDAATGRPLLRVTPLRGPSLRNWTDGVAFTAAGDKLAFGSRSVFSPGGLDVFRLESDRGVRTYRGLSGVVEKVWLTNEHVLALSQNWQLGVWDRRTGWVKGVWDVPAGWTADNSAALLDGDSLLVASGEHATRWDLTGGGRADSWRLPLGVNDHIIPRAGKPPLLVRRDTPVEGASHAPVRVRELGPNGKSTDLFNLIGEKFRRPQVVTASADGLILVDDIQDDGRQSHLFDVLTGRAIAVEADALPQMGGYSLSDSGKVLWATERVSPDVVRTPVVRRADGKVLGTHPFPLAAVDDAGKLGLHSPSGDPKRPWDSGVALYRIGEDRPVVTFDPARPPVPGSVRLSPDGKLVSWGRRDGTVCVADVNTCLDQLAPFGTR